MAMSNVIRYGKKIIICIIRRDSEVYHLTSFKNCAIIKQKG